MTSHQGILRGLLGGLGKLHACERSVAASMLMVRVDCAVSRGMGGRVGGVTAPHPLLLKESLLGTVGGRSEAMAGSGDQKKSTVLVSMATLPCSWK